MDLDNGGGLTQGGGYVAAIAVEYVPTSPEILHLPAMAVREDWRRRGVGTTLFNYTMLMLSLMFRQQEYIHIWGDTNLNPKHVSGSYGPWPTWQKWGMREIGQIAGYRAVRKTGDRGIVFGENVHALRVAITNESEEWADRWALMTRGVTIRSF